MGREGGSVMHRLTQRYRFAAAHTLRSSTFSDDQNLRVYGPCANATGHGHDYAIDITIGSRQLTDGVVWGRGQLDQLIDREIRPYFDNASLADTLGVGFITSGENLAGLVYRRIAPHLPGQLSLVVRVVETEKNSFTYSSE